MIGQLKERITLQKKILSKTANGFEVESWQDVCTLWASVSNLRGREFFAAAAVQAEKTVKFTIRYQKDIDSSMRILFRGKVYNITALDNINYENKYMEIKAREVIQDDQGRA
ncbi:phage head closure protein [Heliorestis acidaminivorans]|uniref:Phage head closure protein n=1 Tax=Heliorestis acidaminivorans TaxID=553427 RepID=A0A6I0EU55_9FIRM|nr:phage head closure protein [Heliorestis acidaminivorans]KAB2953724.1 phage head closure protein [Heliorestis acidaminivorans]